MFLNVRILKKLYDTRVNLCIWVDPSEYVPIQGYICTDWVYILSQIIYIYMHVCSWFTNKRQYDHNDVNTTTGYVINMQIINFIVNVNATTGSVINMPILNFSVG